MEKERSLSMSLTEAQNLSSRKLEKSPRGMTITLPNGYSIHRIEQKDSSGSLCWVVTGKVGERGFRLSAGRPSALAWQIDEYSTFKDAFKAYEANKDLSDEEVLSWLRERVDEYEDSWG